MARSKKDPGEGHNGAPLDEDEVSALEAYYSHKIRAQQRVAAEAKAAYDIEREEVNSLFASVKADLKTSRKEFEDLLAKQDMGEAEFQRYWDKLRARYARNGLPVGAQQDMFAAAADTADEGALAFADGRRAGLAGLDPAPASHIAGIMVPRWMEGYHDGQKELILKLGKAEEILARRGEPDADADPVDVNDDDEELTDAAIAAGVTNLRKSGFMDTGVEADPDKPVNLAKDKPARSGPRAVEPA